MEEFASLMTSNQHSELFTNDSIDYNTITAISTTTATTAAAAANAADSVSTTTSSVSYLSSPTTTLRPTSQALPASSAVSTSQPVSAPRSVSASPSVSKSNLSSTVSVVPLGPSLLTSTPRLTGHTGPDVMTQHVASTSPRAMTGHTSPHVTSSPTMLHNRSAALDSPALVQASTMLALDTTTVSLSANVSQRAVTLSAGAPLSTVNAAAAKSSYSGCQIVLVTVSVITLMVAVVFASLITCQSTCHQFTMPVTKPRRMSQTGPQTRHLVLIFITTAVLHFLQSAVEWTYMGLVVQFAGSVLVWSRVSSISLLLVYWVGYSAGRVICSFLIPRLRPWLLLFSGVLVACVSSLVMLVGSLQFTASGELVARDALMWFSSAVIGLSTSVVLPSSYKYIPSTASLSVAMTIGAGLGQASVPAICALLVDTYSSSFIIKVVFVAAVGATLVSVLLKYVTTRSTSVSTGTLSSAHFQLLDTSSVEELDSVMVTDDIDEEVKLLSQVESVDMETSLIINNPSSSSSASSLHTFIKSIGNTAKND